MTRAAPHLVIGYLLLIAFLVADLALYVSAGDGWRSFGLSVALLALLGLRRELTEQPR